jgi:hypothetical protein
MMMRRNRLGVGARFDERDTPEDVIAGLVPATPRSALGDHRASSP